jgi:hypothetical protein
MFEDRRSSPRRIVQCPGSVVSGANEASQDCIIADISDGGVRLCVKAAVPDNFVLVLKDGSDETHNCRVVWRLDDEVGAEFV